MSWIHKWGWTCHYREKLQKENLMWYHSNSEWRERLHGRELCIYCVIIYLKSGLWYDTLSVHSHEEKKTVQPMYWDEASIDYLGASCFVICPCCCYCAPYVKYTVVIYLCGLSHLSLSYFIPSRYHSVEHQPQRLLHLKAIAHGQINF